MLLPGTTVRVAATRHTSAAGERLVRFTVENAEGGPAIGGGAAAVG